MMRYCNWTRQDFKQWILKEGKGWIAIHKPAGLPVETKKLGMADLEQLVRREYQGVTPSAINRLDQVVEGIVLFALERGCAAELSKQMREGSIEKKYIAIVNGIPDRDEVKLEHMLFHDKRTNMTRIAKTHSEANQAKPARLTYRVMNRHPEEGKSLLEVELDTGRHHQIRAQLSHAGFPIVGDGKYANRQNDLENNSKLRFPLLCATSLSFSDPDTGKRINLQTEPAWLSTWKHSDIRVQK